MNQHRVVLITGKLGAGKTGLARALSERFNFQLLPPDLSVQAERSSEAATSPGGDEEGNRLIDRVVAALSSLDDGQLGIVIDGALSSRVVKQLRSQFRSQLTHVHLYASLERLHQMYLSGEGSLPGALTYDEVDSLEEGEVDLLKADADVRISTNRSDHGDTLVRVAAHLHLLTPPDVKCVDVLVGGQYGSEGKGNIVAYLANEYDVLVRVGGPNAGHTVANAAGKAVHHQLPSGASFSTALLVLGPGFTINVEKLLEEIKKFGIAAHRVAIDPQATIIEQDDIDEECQGVVGAIASTGSGSGAAKARRIRYRGALSSPVRLARDIPELAPFIRATEQVLENAYRSGHSVLLEGTQGSALSLYHGAYPHVTSRDTNVAGCLAEAGISPSRVRRILMVVRTTPIRVANPDGDEGRVSGTLKNETSFEVIAQKAGLVPEEVIGAEITSTTKRKRRVGWFEWGEFRRACNLNAPTDIVLTFVDYLDVKNTQARRFDQLADDTIKFIEEVERVAQAPVSLINTRFPQKDADFEDLRSIIDRRNWTARSERGA